MEQLGRVGWAGQQPKSNPAEQETQERHRKEVEALDQAPWRIVVPAFVIGELRRAFEMGFLVYLPFFVIDIVISSMLMSLGMAMLPPNVISLPFKIIFFVIIDGWRLIVENLIQSFLQN